MEIHMEEKMRKKCKGLFAVFACIFILAACGSSAPEKAQEEISGEIQIALYSLTESTAQQLDEVVRAGMAEEQKANEIIYNGLQSWESAKAEMGEVDFSSDENGDGTADCFTEKSIAVDQEGGYVVTIGVDGSLRSADLVVAYNRELTEYVSIATNINYSFQELMQQAGMNTLLGMGTTFAVLILLSLIIAMFGSILTSTADRKMKEQEEKERKEMEQIAASNASASQKTLAPQPEAQDTKTAAQEDTELMAVIAAAVAAYSAQEESCAETNPVSGPEFRPDPNEFVARRIRRIRRS